MAAIEYLKTRAIYDSYAKKHTLVNFIGQKTNEEGKEDEARNDKDNTNYMYDFGQKLKASSSFTPAMSHSSSVYSKPRRLLTSFSSENMSLKRLSSVSSVKPPQI